MTNANLSPYAGQSGRGQGSTPLVPHDLLEKYLTPERAAILRTIEDLDDKARELEDLEPAFEGVVEENPEAVALADFETTIVLLEEWDLIEASGRISSRDTPRQTKYELTPDGASLFGRRGGLDLNSVAPGDRTPGDWGRNPVPAHVAMAELVHYLHGTSGLLADDGE